VILEGDISKEACCVKYDIMEVANGSCKWKVAFPIPYLAP
jgi:hypothetical protein